jgi:hypothetical protein
MEAGRLAVLRTERGRLRPLWRWAYAGVVRACSAYLRAGEPQSTAYIGGSVGSGRPVYGLSDLDLAVVVPGDGRAPGASSARVRRRWDRLTRALPLMADVVDCCVYEDAHLRDALADSTITYGLDRPVAGPAPAVYHGPSADADKMRLLERPELYGATAAWRRVAGPDRRLADPARDAQRRRIAAWLELQFLWRLAVELCLDPGRPGAASMCVKLVAEPARMSMWLSEGRRTGGREQTLTEALVHMPDEAPALNRALALQRTLTATPNPPLREFLRAFVRLSSRIAGEIGAELGGTSRTEVALLGGDESELALPHGGWEPTGPWPPSAAPRLLALADWRALAYPTMPDETFALVAGDPGDPDRLAAAALVMEKGPYATLQAGGLLIRPFHGGRARLRAVQCSVTDPVSFALVEGRATASFPDVLGWSAHDAARRGVAEHGAWLAQHPVPAEPSGEHLGILIGAARAALFLESTEQSRPELALTAAATARALADRATGARGAAEAAWEAYRQFARDWKSPPAATVIALDEAVRALPPYAR